MSQYMFEFKMDGQSLWSVENTTPTRFEKVKVFAGDDWHEPLDGDMRDLDIRYETKWVGIFSICQQFISYLVWKDNIFPKDNVNNIII